MLKVDIIICKGIVITLYDIAVAINFLSAVVERRSVYTTTPAGHQPGDHAVCMYVHYGDVCYVKCINIAKII